MRSLGMEPRPPFPKQPQNAPGELHRMEPMPDHGENSYRGSGRIDQKRHVFVDDCNAGDPAVTAALSQLGRSGVPVYVIYKPGRAPVVLSEILSVDDVRAELAKL